MAHSSAEYMRQFRSFRKSGIDLMVRWENWILERFVKEPQTSQGSMSIVELSKSVNQWNALTARTLAALWLKRVEFEGCTDLDKIDKAYRKVVSDLEEFERGL